MLREARPAGHSFARAFPECNVPTGTLGTDSGNQMKQKIILSALIAAAILPSESFADNQEIVVTASRIPQPLDSTIADTSVITSRQIRDSGAPDLATLLRSLPGVELVQTGGFGSQASIFMRGTDSTQMLVLLDGVRIDSATLGTTAIEHIMLSDIDHIEVVRGNVSSLYGSQAIGGVIQIFTKKGKGKPSFTVSTGGGNQGTASASAGFSGEVDGTSFGVHAGRFRTEGVSAMNPALIPGVNPNNNGYVNESADASIRHEINQDHAISASLYGTRGNISYDNPFNPAVTDINNIVEKIQKATVRSEDSITDSWKSDLSLSQGSDDSHNYLNGVLQSRYQTDNDLLSWQNNYTISPDARMHVTAEHLRQAVSSTVLFTQTSRVVNSLSAGFDGNHGKHSVQVDIRQDRYSDFGTANTGLLGYGYSFAKAWRATASVSNAFRAPTFDDMYWPLSFGYQGNPNLQPEKSKNWEAGLHYAGNGQHVDMIHFDNRIHNLITINAGFTTMININQATITGDDLIYRGDFGPTHLGFNATFQDPKDAVTGQLLPRRARQYATLSASRDFSAWNVGSELRYSGPRSDANPFTFAPVTLPSYAILNLTSRYTVNRHLDVLARIGNAFNRNYSEAYGYNTLGRTIFVGLDFRQ